MRLFLEPWIGPTDCESAKSFIGECPAEILEIVAALVNLEISTRDHAHDVGADGFAFRAEEAEQRANQYRESINALVQVWGEPDSDDE